MKALGYLTLVAALCLFVLGFFQQPTWAYIIVGTTLGHVGNHLLMYRAKEPWQRLVLANTVIVLVVVAVGKVVLF